MATTAEYVDFVCERIDGMGAVRRQKMFGEYMVYLNGKPIFLVCDNTVFVKIIPELSEVMADAQRGLPYPGGKEHYILDIENAETTQKAASILEAATPLPNPRKKKGALK